MTMSILSKITAYGKGLGKPGGTKHLNPVRDWLVVLVLAFVLLAGSIAWNTWFFFVALTDESTTVPSAREDTLDTSSIEKARALFDVRAAEEGKYRTEYHFNDPSK